MLSCCVKMDVRRKLEKRCSEFVQNPIKQKYKPRLCEPELPRSVWKVFFRQNDAVSYSENLRENVMVFSTEKTDINANSGARNFIVSSLEEFWFYYNNFRPDKRHFYEVIQENKPCKLYFDLEFNRTLNPEVNGELLIEIWIRYVNECIFKEFNLKCNRCNVVELDSTSDKKFSQHLIWHLPDYTIFKNNIEVGKFVQKICKNLKIQLHLNNENKPDTLFNGLMSVEIENLFINVNEENNKWLFVDTGVYTKNRNFRLFLSSKNGKNVTLNLSKNSQFNFFKAKKVKNINKDQQVDLKSIFLASLITNCKQKNLNVLEFKGQQFVTEKFYSKVTKPNTKNQTSVAETKHKNIPFKELSKYVTLLMKGYNENANVRKYTYFPTTQTILHEIEGTRYCENIKREHKSNNIMIIADLKLKAFYQKCYDPDCLNFRSPLVCFPDEISEKLSTLNEEVDLDDMELLQSVEMVEKKDLIFNMSEISDSQLLLTEQRCFESETKDFKCENFDGDVTDFDLIDYAEKFDNKDEEIMFKNCDISDKELIEAALNNKNST